MKSAKIVAVILLFISFSFTNCSQNQDHLFTTDEIITRGNWGVEFFIDENKTQEYSNYVFRFSPNGTLQSNDGVNSIEGTWDVIRDVDRSDLLTITLSDQAHLVDLNNTWVYRGKSTVGLRLQAKGNASEFRIRQLR